MNVPTNVMIGLSVVLALVPVIVWSKLLLQEEGRYKKIFIWVFLGGTLSVFPIFGIQKLWAIFPALDIFSYITNAFGDKSSGYILTFIVVGILEELTKWNIVRIVDRHHPEFLQTLKGAVKFGIASGLGFAFAENIFYFYNIWKNMGLIGLLLPFIFRSMFTVAGHMIFSGIFGYFYGLSKFAEDIRAQEEWTGVKFKVVNFLHRLLHISSTEWYKKQLLIQGLAMALGIHALFNFLLQMNKVHYVIALIAASFTYMMYLWKRKSGHLIFTMVGKRESTMAPRDEDVVLELMGMWFNEGRYQEIINICDRLLLRDPDNNVVKLFRAKAVEKARVDNVQGSVKMLFGEGDKEKDSESSVLDPTTTEKPKNNGEPTFVMTKK